jgi:hypothetical protein
VLSRNTDNPELVRHYKKYCKILSDIIKLAKKHYYNKLITNSKNKVKTTWDIIKSLTNSKPSTTVITSVSREGKSHNNPQTIANMFDSFQFSSLLFMCRVNSYKANYRHSTV